MDEEKILQLLKGINNELKQLNNQSHSKIAEKLKDERIMGRNLSQHIIKSEIKNEISVLIKESYMLGLSGKPCPTCGGTGRV